MHGVVLSLASGTATLWGGTETLSGIENAWGSQLADDLTGLALAGTRSFLRGLAGDDTLRAPAAGTLVTADYSADPAGIVADLWTGRVQDGWGGSDLLAGIEQILGSGFDGTASAAGRGTT